MIETYMELAYQQALKAYKIKEVPIGAILVKNDRIIARGYNRREKKHQIVEHAELMAITKANKKIKNWRLEDCDLYVTLEPCMMCLGAILQSRIRNVYYAIPAENSFLNKIDQQKTKFIKFDAPKKYLELLQQFFKEQRK